MGWHSRLGRFSLVLSAALFAASMTANAQKPAAAPAPKPLPVVSVDALQTMLPEMAGWTRGQLTGDVVRVSEDTGYSFAVGDYANAAAKVHLTVGDTVGVGDCLMALAATISVLPEGYSEKVPPATEISRFTYEGFQAASKWNADKLAGEFSVLVNGRFVVKAEGEGLDSLDTLKGFVEKVDLKKLGDLKPSK